MKIHKIGVIGSGLVAQGIAQIVAHSKLEVVLFDECQEWLDRSMATIGLTIDNEISRWGLTPSDKKAILKRITPTTDITELGSTQILLEAKGISIEEKQGFFSRVEEICGPETIFMTNVTTISITDIQKHLKIPERLVGLHFIPPVQNTPVVEVIKGCRTTDHVVQVTRILMETLGKRPIEVFEFPGLITSRIILPMINTAAQVLMEGLASAEDIDESIHLGFNMPQGPLAIADGIGIDLVLQHLESIFRNLGDPTYRPCPLFRKMVREGRLGIKSGEGFFKYDEMNRRIRS